MATAPKAVTAPVQVTLLEAMANKVGTHFFHFSRINLGGQGGGFGKWDGSGGFQDNNFANNGYSGGYGGGQQGGYGGNEGYGGGQQDFGGRGGGRGRGRGRGGFGGGYDQYVSLYFFRSRVILDLGRLQIDQRLHADRLQRLRVRQRSPKHCQEGRYLDVLLDCGTDHDRQEDS